MPKQTPQATSTVLEESDSFADSSSTAYWLNSGGLVYLLGTSTIASIQGDLSLGSKWQENYASSNPTDTDNGLHPQNVLRLFTDRTYGDASYQAYIKINRLNLSSSPNRNESNGIFLMIRAKDSDNLYYAGLRVDGSAVIKKKVNGTYYTLAESPVFAYAAYDKNSTPNLLPLGIWLGLKADVHTLSNGRVDIIFSIDIGGSGNWIPLLDTIDTPSRGNLSSLPGSGHAGIRTDFMDVDIRDFQVTSS